jgi:aspartyl-tRNA(Asn)/glutamyl-tRNA(Gln) amidotransferase subunit B
MEVHAELKTASKMFCGCKNDPFHASGPNVHTCPVCLGMPGALPVANKTAIEWTIKLGLALGCKINLFSKFDRKHYFYPDLPKGYQISQYDLPFCYDGAVETSEGTVRIRRIHLEEDTGKLLHKTVNGKKVSLIDFNRSSVPLIEIVTEPDIKTARQAKEYGKKLRQILRFLDIADCDMEQGGMRLEANVSVREKGATELPDYKIELKNINSFRFLEAAIEYEIDRQATALEAGETLPQETRGWNPSENKSFVQRTKESAEDYRYFPDPDLPPIRFTQEQIDEMRSQIPLLPEKIILDWVQLFRVERRFAEPLAETQNLAKAAEKLFSQAQSDQLEPNKLAGAIHNKKIDFDENSDPKTVLQSFKALYATESVDTSELDTIIQKIISENQDAVEKYKNGQKQIVGFFMGQVMRQLKVKADPQQVTAALGKALDNC